MMYCTTKITTNFHFSAMLPGCKVLKKCTTGVALKINSSFISL